MRNRLHQLSSIFVKVFSPTFIFFYSFLLFHCKNTPTDRDHNGLAVLAELQSSWVRNFNPLSPSGLARWATSSGIYEPLFIYNSLSQDFIPWLGLKYSWSKNNKVLEIILRSGVLWSDGEPFSAKDVSFTYNLVKKYPALDTRDSWSYLDNVEAVDDTTVEFEFKRAYVPGFYDLVTRSIVPEHLWSEVNDPVKFSNPNPVGTGPFTEIIRFEKQIFELGKNPYYWNRNKPIIEKLVFNAYSGNEAATLALINGDLDWTGIFIPSIERVFVQKDPEHHKYWFSPTGYSSYLYLNTTKPFFRDKNIRKAISYAIDRELMIEVGMYNYMAPAHVTGLSAHNKIWYAPDLEKKENWVVYNLDLSNRLLDSLGFLKNDRGYRISSDSSILSFEIICVSGWSDQIRSAQILSSNLKKIGIDVKVQSFDFGTWISRLQRGEFDMSFGWGDMGGTNPFRLFKGLMSFENVKPVGEIADVNWHRFGLSSADSLFSIFEEISDPDRIKSIIFQLQDLFIEHAPALPINAVANYAQCNTKYFTNFPSEDNPYTVLAPYSSHANLLVLLNLKKRGK
tara:strand:+ start:6178 stop:7872 length:1695 start_codon:yes stop_codon:yes gene_type:complete